jgi:hypothetical protein
MKRVLLLVVLVLSTFHLSTAEEGVPSFRIKNVHHILLTVKDLDALQNLCDAQRWHFWHLSQHQAVVIR